VKIWFQNLLSKSTCTATACWAPATIAYCCYLATTDTKAWLGRRESLITQYRMAIIVFFLFIVSIEPPDDDYSHEAAYHRARKCPNRHSSGERFRNICTRFMNSAAVAIASPMRIERHLLVEGVCLTMIVTGLASFCAMDFWDAVLEWVASFLLNIVTSNLLLWRYERAMRVDYDLCRAKVTPVSERNPSDWEMSAFSKYFRGAQGADGAGRSKVGLPLPRVSDWLHGPHWLSSIGVFDHTPY
jgi:hypothetical protein